jgi:sulfotransferase
MIHFIAGLPRSGSTLLAAILRQNPRFHAGMTSPAGSIFRQIEIATAGNIETAVFVSDEQRDRMLRQAIVADWQIEKTHFDTNRFWCARLPVLARLFPESKVIACVRDCGWIYDSFERLYRRNGMRASGIYNWDTTGTVYTRTVALAASGGVVGFSLDALREACASEEKDRLLLIEYEDLCKAPGHTLKRIYRFIGEQPFAHDFDHVEYSAGEFDKQLGAKGLHDVNGKVEWRPRKTILPPDLFARYDKDQFWRPK